MARTCCVGDSSFDSVHSFVVKSRDFVQRLVLTFLFVQSSVAIYGQEEGVVTESDVFQALALRSTTMKSARIEWKEKCFRAKGSLVQPDSPSMVSHLNLTIPPEDVTYECDYSLSFDGKKTRFTMAGKYPQESGLIDVDDTETFDGNSRRVFQLPSQKVAHPLGRIYPNGRQNNLLSMLVVEPVLLCYRVQHPEMNLIDMERYRIVSQDSLVDGRACVLFSGEPQGSSVKTQRHFWLDPSRDFIIQRFERHTGDRVSQQTNFTWKQHDNLGWILAGWDVALYNRDGSPQATFDATIERFDVNPEIPHSEFDLTFPALTYVDDLSDVPVNYILRPDGTRRMVTAAENTLTYEELLKSKPEDALRSTSRPRSLVLVALNLFVFAIAVFLTIWRIANRVKEKAV